MERDGECTRSTRARTLQAHSVSNKPAYTCARKCAWEKERRQEGRKTNERGECGEHVTQPYARRHQVLVFYIYERVYSVFVTRFLRLFPLIASSSCRDKRRLWRVTFTTYSDTLLEEVAHTGVKNRGKSIVKRRGAPMATTETAWQSLPLVCLSLSSSSLVLSSFFFVRFSLCLSTDVSDHLFSSPATPNSSPLSLYFFACAPHHVTDFLSLAYGLSVLVSHRCLFDPRCSADPPRTASLISPCPVPTCMDFQRSENSYKPIGKREATAKKNRRWRGLGPYESRNGNGRSLKTVPTTMKISTVPSLERESKAPSTAQNDGYLWMWWRAAVNLLASGLSGT